MLIRQIYVSRASNRKDSDLAEILEWSHTANAALGVTGILLFLDEVYMQYLEGEAAMVDALFASIRLDFRHRKVTPLERRLIPKRAFPFWKMALIEWTPETKAIFRSFSPGTQLDLYEQEPETAAPFLRALSTTPGWRFK